MVADHSLQPFPKQLVGYNSTSGKLEFSNDNIAYDCGVHTSLDWGVVALEVFSFIIGILAVHIEFFHNKFMWVPACLDVRACAPKLHPRTRAGGSCTAVALQLRTNGTAFEPSLAIFSPPSCSIMSAFSVLTPLTILVASVYVKISYSFASAKYTKNEMGLSTEIAAAGAIIVSISNLFFLGLFGMEEAVKQLEAEGKQGDVYAA